MIEDQIGSGGMGAVYRAIDQKFGSRVAIKETFYGDSELSAAFEREARLLNGLHHPILPHVSDSFTENGGNFLVMEYIEGEDLSELLKRGEVFEVDTVVEWAFELLDGIDYLHSQNPPVIHRDIKPNNLKLTPRGKLVLLDFGMAKETTSNTSAARSVFGYSRRYSPLEQIEGIGTDERSDIFSLGASLYHLMTGTPPADVLARASAIVAGKPDPLVPANVVNPEIPESIASVLNSALALSAENRFRSAHEMSDALEAAINDDVVVEERENVGVVVVPVEQPGLDSASDPASVPRDVVDDSIAPQSDSSEPGFVGAARDYGSWSDAVAAAVGVGYPEKPVTTEAAEKPFTAQAAVENFRSPMQSTTPPISETRVRRPSRFSYAVWVPILLLCLGLAVLGTYRLSQRSGEAASNEMPPVSSASPAEEVAATAQEEQTADPDPALTEESQVEDELPPAADEALILRKGPVVVKEDAAPRTSDEPSTEKKLSRSKPAPTERSNERATQRRQNQSTRARTSRRYIRPAFEQPSVSSIEAIMTGVPYERRARWVYERDWNEDERRRRRMRRARRYYQPPF